MLPPLKTIFEENDIKFNIIQIKNNKDILNLYFQYMKPYTPLQLLQIVSGCMYVEVLDLHKIITGRINQVFLDLKIQQPSLEFLQQKPNLIELPKFIEKSLESFNLSLNMIEFKLLSLKNNVN